MARTSKISPEDQITIKKHFLENELPKGRGAIKRTVEKFKPDMPDLTEAIVKGIVLPPSEKPAKKSKAEKKPKAEKPTKVKKPRKAKTEKSVDSMELFKQLREAEKEVSRIKAALLKILG